MTAITHFGSGELTYVQNRILQTLKALETELGVKFAGNGGKYGATNGYIRIGVEVQNNGNGKTGSQSEYERLATSMGLKPNWFGQSFYSEGTEYKIVSVNIGSPKYRLMVDRVHDGKKFRATVAMCKTGLEAAVAAGRIAA